MATKTIPFDLETAKKIQAGEIEGKIKTRNGEDVSIVLWSKKDEDGYVILALIDMTGTDLVASYTRNGEISKGYEASRDLVLEVPDNEPQFKPFDFEPFERVLVRDEDDDIWSAGFYSNWYKGVYWTTGGMYAQCIPYKCNEELLGTANKPKED